MRFAPIVIATVAAFGFAAAAPVPAPAAPNGLLQDLGAIISGLESSLGITTLENKLYSFLKLNAVDDLAGITKLENSLKLSNEKSHKGLLQALGNVVANLEKSLGVTKIDDALSKKLGLDKIEDFLGITKLEKVGLGL